MKADGVFFFSFILGACLFASHALSQTQPACPWPEEPKIHGKTTAPESVTLYKALSGGGAGEWSAQQKYGRYHKDWQAQKKQHEEWAVIVHEAGQAHANNASNYGHHCVYGTALFLYKKIAEDVGKSAPYLHQWVRNQQKVFQACSSNTHDNGEPVFEVTKDDPHRALFDLEYQRASTYFYRRDFMKAEELYKKIFANEKHPYRALAAYMVARAMKATRRYTDAYDWISALKGDTALREEPELLEEYKFVAAYYSCADEGDRKRCVDTNKRHLQFLKATVLKPEGPFGKAYADATVQLARYLQDIPAADNKWWFSPTDDDSPRLAAYHALAKKDAFLDWLQAFNVKTHNWHSYARLPVEEKELADRVLNHAIARWEAGDGDAWLYLAATRMRAGHHALAKVLDSAEKLFARYKCSPAPEGVLAARRLWPFIVLMRMDAVLTDELIDELAVGHDKEHWGPDSYLIHSVVSLLQHQRRYDDLKRLAEAFIRHGKYHASLYTRYLNFVKTPEVALNIMQRAVRTGAPAYEADHVAGAIMNRLSTSEILDLLEKGVVPVESGKRFARASLVRAVLLEDRALFVRAATQVARTHAFLASDIEELLQDSDGDPADKYVTLFLLENPRFNIYANDLNREFGGKGNADFRSIDKFNHNDNNWWCKADPTEAQRAFEYKLMGLKENDDGYIEEKRDFFAAAESDTWLAAPELVVLASKQNGPEYLTRQTIALARSRQGFMRQQLAKLGIFVYGTPHMPRMLRQAVVTTRYGCTRNGGHGVYSREAFRILHADYPDSEAAKKTPYWFDKRTPR